LIFTTVYHIFANVDPHPSCQDMHLIYGKWFMAWHICCTACTKTFGSCILFNH